MDTRRPSSPFLPRDQAGSAELIGGTGPITGMCSVGQKFLEIYKQDRTFRVETPETIDPERTIPNAPWVTSAVSEIGSSSKSVSRVLLQSRDILEAGMFEPPIEKKKIVQSLHSCKESLVACELLSQKITAGIDLIVNQIQETGVTRDNGGRGLNPFPQVAELEPNCAAFLIHANRAIKLICELPFLFLSLERKDSNFDRLHRQLEPLLPKDSPILSIVGENARTIEYIINLRNFHEHPGLSRTVIRNFHVLPDGRISAPTWQLQGNPSADLQPINLEIPAIISFLQETAEFIFIFLVQHCISKTFPFYIEEIDEEKIDQAIPIRYRLGIDMDAILRNQQKKDV
jgi:hypothetical protein